MRSTWNKRTFAFPRIYVDASASLVAQKVKNLPAIQETLVWSLCQEDLLEKEMATHSSILAWRIPWTEEPGGLQSKGLQRVVHDRATNPFIPMPTSISVSFWPHQPVGPRERHFTSWDRGEGRWFTAPISAVLSVCCPHWPQALPVLLLTSSEHCVWTSGNLTLVSGEKSLPSCSSTLRILL